LEQERPVLRAVCEAIERTEGLRHLGSRRRRTNVATTSASASGPPPLEPVSQHPAALGGGGASGVAPQAYDADGVQPSCPHAVHHEAAQVIACTVSGAQATASVRSW